MRTMPEAIEQTAPSLRKSVLDILFGPPLADADDTEKIGPAAGIPVFGLDALSSAAYGPEAALTLLLALGSVGIAYTMPIVLTIIVLLSIVYFSYRQIIAACPDGGGSYTVASDNLGARAGLIAGAALLVDYILNVVVGTQDLKLFRMNTYRKTGQGEGLIWRRFGQLE